MSSLPLTFSLTPPHLHRLNFLSDPTTTTPTLSLLSKPQSLALSTTNSFACYSYSPSSSSNSNDANSFYEKEEARWLREEQRWLREEQRWLREEQRWKAERDTLLREIQTLQLKIEEIERQNSTQQSSVSEAVANIAKLLQVVKDGDLRTNIDRIAETGSSAIPLVVDSATKENEEVVVKEVVYVTDTRVKEESKRKTLRKGSEGDDVREMQEALQKLGFYSGEEDMEYSAFSSGTERAVKTWQASLDMSEDGIMTPELLRRLYMDQKDGASSFPEDKIPESHAVTASEKTSNGVPVASVTENPVKEDVGEAEVSHHRVFLLGENRWEEPSRLSSSKKQHEMKSGSNSSATKCLSCRGEGRLLCMECDGTGEPNIEEQFLDWVDEGAKCPYCEGHGFIACDVCGGGKGLKT